MRRSAFAFAAVFIVTVAIAPAAYALGPGGWDHVGHGATSTTPSFNGAVYALYRDPSSTLYVGGSFTSAGGNFHAQRIAAWDGAQWSSPS
jgi:hypothetical protein